MDFDELLQKINKECYEPKNHKNGLKAALVNNEYFKKEIPGNNWYTNFAIPSFSLALTIFIILGTFNPTPKINEKISIKNNENTLYGRLSKNNNIIKTDYGNGIKQIEINQENVKTKLYFNNKNILIRSQAENK